MGKSGKGVSRRDFLAFWRRPSAPPAPSLPIRLRPPGALPELAFVDTCQRCGRCVAACPAEAIRPLGAAWGTAGGTPAIDARQTPCVVCSGLDCTHVCPTGALRPLAAAAEIAMGTAVLDERCLTYRGEACDACLKSCPLPGAIWFGPEGRAQVDVSRCVGCGLCEHVCPMEPTAIRVVPRLAS